MILPSEDLIHYIWKTKNLDLSNLLTTEGQKINIIQFGYHNESDGPDFLQAKVEIDGILWNGSIEMHVKSSDWIAHGHGSDPNYENTILHVVYTEDKSIKRNVDMSTIPCLELKNRISASILDIYHQLDRSKWVPCESLIDQTSDISQFLAREKALVSRLERRWEEVKETNDELENNWEETAYRLICRAFGLVHNADSFIEISKRIPFSIVKKNADNIHNLEAMFYGVSGLLTVSNKDQYPQRLKANFEFLQKKYSLEVCQFSLNHKAVRPQNFPEIALSQFIALMSQPQIFSKLMNANLKELEKLLKVSASEYWNNHYTFDNLSKTKKKTLGISKTRIIIINAIVPMYYFLSKKLNDETWATRAFDLLEQIPAEKNSIISKWKERGLNADTSYDSQALLELKKNFCTPKRCLTCPIGHHLLKG